MSHIDIDNEIYTVAEAVNLVKSLAIILQTAYRSGAEKDIPEGARFVTLSDTLVCKLTKRLEEAYSILEHVGIE